MTKTINKLVEDIYSLLGSGKVVNDDDVKSLGHAMAGHITNALKKREPVKGQLRASTIGQKCDRKSWYQYNTPELAEEPSPWAKLKFLFGHLHEELTLFLAEQTGHTVVHRQTEVEVDGVPGHPDAVVDGVILDVKSASSRGMDKFRGNKLETDDPFGYLDQLDFYRCAMVDSPDVTNKEDIAFLACDKEMGHLVLDTYTRNDDHLHLTKKLIEHKKDVVNLPEPPPRGFMDEKDGQSGNKKLCMECSYCDYKHSCWSGLRTFLYSGGPRFLTKVVREPDVPEVRS